MSKIAFLGPAGTVSEEAAHYFLSDTGLTYELVPYKLIPDLFLAADSGEVDYCIIPIENTIDSSVTLHLDWLVHEVDLPIQAEWVYPSIQNLIGYREEVNAEAGINTIISIPIAIAQCRKFLQQHYPDVVFEHVPSTAEGIRIVKENPGKGWAAIGTALGAKHYDLDIIASSITDHSNNFTRFILVGREKPRLQKSAKPQEKTTILINNPSDYPGALHQVLSAFAWRKINLSKIESRPTRKELGSYYFYIDIELGLDSVLLPAAIEEIEAIGCHVRLLGSYNSYPYIAQD